VLAAGIGLVSAPAHAEHLRPHRRADRVGQDRIAVGPAGSEQNEKKASTGAM
jgi:hypothetical protein